MGQKLLILVMFKTAAKQQLKTLSYAVLITAWNLSFLKIYHLISTFLILPNKYVHAVMLDNQTVIF